MYELSSTFNSWLKYSLVFTGGQRREQMSWSHKYVTKLSLFFLYCHFLCYLSAINIQWYSYTIWNKLISADISAQLVCNLLYYCVGDGWQKDLWGITNSCVHFWLVQKKKNCIGIQNVKSHWDLCTNLQCWYILYTEKNADIANIANMKPLSQWLYCTVETVL